MEEKSKKSLDSAISNLRKRLGETAVFKGGENINVEVDSLSTGSLTLDLALGVGGVPLGRVVEISGVEGGGKSLMALMVIREGQKKGMSCAYIDAEHSLDKVWCNKLGVDFNNLLISQPETFEDALDIIEKLVEGGVGVLVFDSVPALPSKGEMDRLSGQATVGLHAKAMTAHLRKLTPTAARSKTICLYVNQLRDKIGVMWGDSTTTTSGRALKHGCAVRLRVGKMSGTSIKDSKGELIGHRIKVKVAKNKVAAPFKEAEFDIYYERGIDQRSEIAEVAIQRGLIERLSNVKYKYKDKEWKGRNNLENDIKENEALANELLENIKKNFEEKPSPKPKEEQGQREVIDEDKLVYLNKPQLVEKAKKLNLGAAVYKMNKEELVRAIQKVDSSGVAEHE